jgi:hypothetical protein
VKKEEFLSYIKNPEEISDNDISMLEEFVSKYPYFQVGHLFLAKLAHETNKPDKTLKLNHAALHTLNRTILKRIIEDGWQVLPQAVNQPFTPTVQLNPGTENVNESYPSMLNDTPESESAPPVEPQNSDVASQIKEAIQENRKLRKQFEEQDSDTPEATQNQEEINNIVEDPRVILKPDNTGKEESGKGELKKKNQFEIIDNFISYESSLVKRKLKIPDGPSAPQEDLSLKSSSLNDDLVSENLALIMKNQGKIDLAIDIYKKLIWKFPQKKAYFASLIEELKK